MTATVLDDRRRLVMPPELPAKSAVIVERLDQDTWVVRRARRSGVKLVALLPDVENLSMDPEWQAIESRIVAKMNKNVSPCEE
jgi:hypothetical protein